METLTPPFAGPWIAAPRNVTFDDAGRIYFTIDERPFFLSQGRGDKVRMETGPATIGACRIDPESATVQVLGQPELRRLNGIAVSPDDRTLYLIENDIPAEGCRQLLAFDLSAGQAANRRVLKDFYPGRSGDGLAVDCEGNIYVAARLNALRGTAETLDVRASIHVLAPDGWVIGFVPIPEDAVTNLTFAGPDRLTIYVTAAKTPFTFRNDRPGLAR